MFEMWNKNPNFDISITAKATKPKPNDKHKTQIQTPIQSSFSKKN